MGTTSDFAVVVSDVHLGYDEETDKECFLQFLRTYFTNRHVAHLVLLGDIFDLWRRGNQQVVDNNDDVLTELISLVDNGHVEIIDYVVGNHDFTIESALSDISQCRRASDIIRLRQNGQLHFYGGVDSASNNDCSLETDGHKFYLTHGHDLEWAGILTDRAYHLVLETLCSSTEITGPAMAVAWRGITIFDDDEGSPLTLVARIKLFLLKRWIQRDLLRILEAPATARSTLKGIFTEDYRREDIFQFPEQGDAEQAVMGIAERWTSYNPADQYLVFGHTHQSGQGVQVSNTGCWYRAAHNDRRLLVISSSGAVNLMSYP